MAQPNPLPASEERTRKTEAEPIIETPKYYHWKKDGVQNGYFLIFNIFIHIAILYVPMAESKLLTTTPLEH